MGSLRSHPRHQSPYDLLEQLVPHLTPALLYPAVSAINDEPQGQCVDILMHHLAVPFRSLAFEAAMRLESGARHKTAREILRHLPNGQEDLALLTALAFIRDRNDYSRFLSGFLGISRRLL